MSRTSVPCPVTLIRSGGLVFQVTMRVEPKQAKQTLRRTLMGSPTEALCDSHLPHMENVRKFTVHGEDRVQLLPMYTWVRWRFWERFQVLRGSLRVEIVTHFALAHDASRTRRQGYQNM